MEYGSNGYLFPIRVIRSNPSHPCKLFDDLSSIIHSKMHGAKKEFKSLNSILPAGHPEFFPVPEKVYPLAGKFASFQVANRLLIMHMQTGVEASPA
jgi:hypothetical protein